MCTFYTTVSHTTLTSISLIHTRGHITCISVINKRVLVYNSVYTSFLFSHTCYSSALTTTLFLCLHHSLHQSTSLSDIYSIHRVSCLRSKVVLITTSGLNQHHLSLDAAQHTHHTPQPCQIQRIRRQILGHKIHLLIPLELKYQINPLDPPGKKSFSTPA